MIALTAQQMRDADARAGKRLGETALMRNAGKGIAALIRRMVSSGRIVAFAGPGNNGGDAYAAFAELDDAYTCVILSAESPHPSAARADAAGRAGNVKKGALPRTKDEARAALEGCALAVDALFGTGSRLPLPAEYAPAIAALDECNAPVLAIDIPSGIDADTGRVAGTAVRATRTIALGALKPGLFLEPARDCTGELWFSPIGIERSDIAVDPPQYAVLGADEFLHLLPRRPANADKRSAGAPLIIAGSSQFPGAAVLCARGAARAGAGYVTVATSQAAAPALRAHLIEQVVVTTDDAAGAEAVARELLDISSHNSAVGIGPGLGLDDRTGEIVRRFARECTLPMVIDASALFHFAKHLDILKGKQCVMTPHAGEFARLSGKGTFREDDRVERVREFVERTGITTLLKGRTTIVDDGRTVHVNSTGTPALATAGTGDVLTGIIATLLSQGLAPVDAARAGAYWHGLAGQLCAQRRRVGVIAGDLPEALADAVPEPVATEGLRRIF